MPRGLGEFAKLERAGDPKDGEARAAEALPEVAGRSHSAADDGLEPTPGLRGWPA